METCENGKKNTGTIAFRFRQVLLYFTRHGVHLNNTGKEWISKLVATQIHGLVKSNNKEKPVIVLNWKDEPTNKQIPVNVHSVSKTSLRQNNSNQTDIADKENVVCTTSNRQKRVPFTRHNDFFMATVTSDSQKSLIPQHFKESSPNQSKNRIPKENLNIKDNDANINHSCQKDGRKPLNIYHQHIRGLRGKINELISHLHPAFPHILCFTEHHMSREELQQTFIECYILGSNYCRTSYAKGGLCTYVHNSLYFENLDLEIYCMEKTLKSVL
jgi:hypothetical protein